MNWMLLTCSAEGEGIMFKKYLKPKRVPYLGEFIDAFFTTLPFFGLYSTLSLTIILYAQVSEWLIVWLPWMNLWIFMLIVGFALSIALFLAYKYIIPSLWGARSSRMYHIGRKLDVILEEQKKINRLLDEIKGKKNK